ncbi:oxygen-independent coproporphyrinogen-III oxidase-like protein HemZ [Oxobacter pfennigii]|uniref:Oxygen-independent coproporphyrinogen-III oxidase-like protein HemZ n=1 Tax=Oxobacter pfennigii TaxID=36849 RepID=A0A0P8WR01_9CLOT|nr:coproporphyrinogen dehydrogenase HemZ [Oxobacter pfennigii]KPU44981.1 oxygen-independent coproporphyrinogen-III oxidase-like protein HemZ [Oxobacter pfennigii]
MYYVLLEGHNYSYEIYEMVTLYFPQEKITTINSEDELPVYCRYIKSFISVNEDKIKGSCFLYHVESGVKNLISSSEESLPIDENIKKLTKHCVKITAYNMLKNLTGVNMPWGILVGIRPAKIVNDLKSKDSSIDEIKDILGDKYRVREDKINLVTKVSDISYPLINTDSKNISIYIGIPFCPTRCVYCSFAAYPIKPYEKYISSYIEALKYEMDELSRFIDGKFKIDTLYIGGGTPTSLDDDSFYEVINHAAQKFHVKSLKEFTVEAGRPDTITKEKLDIMHEHMVDRISINPQTMNDDTLKRIGRLHSVKDIIDKYELARKYNFNSINMDMIVGLPGETEEDIKNTLDEIIKLNPENITVHSMSLKRASKLKEEIISGKEDNLNSDNIYDALMEYIYTNLFKNHYTPYYMYRQKKSAGNLENVGYCIKDKECLYNIQMIEEKETIIGIGADSVTKMVFTNENRIERYANKKDLTEYINTIKESTEKKIKALGMLT